MASDATIQAEITRLTNKIDAVNKRAAALQAANDAHDLARSTNAAGLDSCNFLLKQLQGRIDALNAQLGNPQGVAEPPLPGPPV